MTVVSSPPRDADLLAKASEVWKELDALAQSDPEAYKNRIEATLAASPSLPTIHPSFSIKTQTTTKTLSHTHSHFINFLSSSLIDAPTIRTDADWSSTTVPMVLDDPRVRVSVKGDRYTVYDVIVHPIVTKRAEEKEEFMGELVQLAKKEVMRAFKVPLKKGYKEVYVKYKGIFQWDESGKKKTGVPEKDDPMYAKKAESQATLEEVLKFAKKCDDVAEQVKELAIGLEPTKNDSTFIANTDTKKPLIAELDEKAPISSSSLNGKKMPEYQCNCTEKGMDIVLKLNGQTSSRGINVSMKEGKLVVETNEYGVEFTPTIKISHFESRFSRQSETLTVSISQ